MSGTQPKIEKNVPMPVTISGALEAGVAAGRARLTGPDLLLASQAHITSPRLREAFGRGYRRGRQMVAKFQQLEMPLQSVPALTERDQ